MLIVLVNTLEITDEELTRDASKDDYVQLLMAVRMIT